MAYGFMRMHYNARDRSTAATRSGSIRISSCFPNRRPACLFQQHGNGRPTRDQLLEAFLDRYYPASDAPSQSRYQDFTSGRPIIRAATV
jgi:hypothetical protein